MHYRILEKQMGAGSSVSNANEGIDCLRSFLLFSRRLFLESNNNSKRRRSQPVHVEFNSLKDYGYHFKSKAILSLINSSIV